MDALTQEEIDALKEAVKSGTDLGGDDSSFFQPEDKVKVIQYDFRKPKLVSAESLHAIQMMHEEASKAMELFLSSEIKATGTVSLATMDQITYWEFVMSCVTPTFIIRIKVGDLGHFALEIEMPVVLSILDVILGGDGAQIEAGSHEVTALERTVLEGFCAGLVDRLNTAWSVFAPLKMEIRDVVTNPEYLQICGPETPCLNLSHDVKVASASGLISICYPISLVQGILKIRDDRSGGRPEQAGGTGMLKAVSDVPLQVRAVLGDLVVVAEDLGHLEVGDIVCMDKAVDEPVDVMLGEEALFTGYLGRRKDKAAVELLGYKVRK